MYVSVYALAYRFYIIFYVLAITEKLLLEKPNNYYVFNSAYVCQLLLIKYIFN